MNLYFRKAVVDDIPLLISLEESARDLKVYSGTYSRDEWTEELKIGVVYIIERNGVPVGDVMYEKKSEGYFYIDKILVLPEHQGQGIAKIAMEYILSEIGEAKRIDLVTHPENNKAVNLYASLGFAIESRKEDYFGDGEPRIVMVKIRD